MTDLADFDRGHARQTWNNGGALAVAHRFAHVADIFEGFGDDGIDGDRLVAGVQWALTGEPETGAADDLIRLFEAPWLAAADESEFTGDARHEALMDIDRVGAEAIALAERARLVVEERNEWVANVRELLADDRDVIRCCEGGGPESLVGSLVLTVTRTRSKRDTAEFQNGQLRAILLMDSYTPEQALSMPISDVIAQARQLALKADETEGLISGLKQLAADLLAHLEAHGVEAWACESARAFLEGLPPPATEATHLDPIVLAMLLAHDAEDSAQKGEPSPWREFLEGEGAGWDRADFTWADERRHAMRAAILAALKAAPPSLVAQARAVILEALPLIRESGGPGLTDRAIEVAGMLDQ